MARSVEQPRPIPKAVQDAYTVCAKGQIDAAREIFYDHYDEFSQGESTSLFHRAALGDIGEEHTLTDPRLGEETAVVIRDGRIVREESPFYSKAAQDKIREQGIESSKPHTNGKSHTSIEDAIPLTANVFTAL